MKYWSKKDLFFFIPALFLLFAGSWQLQRDWSGIGGTGQTEEIGRIVYKVRVAERLFQGETLWTPVLQNGPVFNFDTIRTDKGSSAVLTLNDGTEIAIDESTMVIISWREEGTLINLEGGNLSVSNEEGGTGLVKVVSGDSALELSGSSAGFSRTGRVTDVSVTRGDVRWSGSGQKKTLNAGEGFYRIEQAPETVTRPVRLLTPADRSLVVNPGTDRTVTLKWERRNEASGPLTLEVSRTRDFAEPAIRKETAGTEETVALEEGKWYWRLVDQEGTAAVSSSFTVLTDTPPEPSAGRDHPVKPDRETRLVPLAWRGSERASGYRVEIARDAGFTDIVMVKKTRTAGLSLAADALPEGEYHYRVSSLYPFADGPLTGSSARVAFGAITEKKNNDPPGIPVLQRKKTGLAGASGSSRMILSWDTQMDADLYEVSFYDEAGGVIKKETVSDPRLAVPVLASGQYTWDVRSRTGGEWSEPSEKGVLILKEPSPPVLKSPGPDAVLAGGADPRFTWSDPDQTGPWIIEVSTDRDFGQIALTSTGKERTWFPGQGRITAGTWYWRVKAASGSSPERVSEVRSFVVPHVINSPIIKNPVRNQVVDVFKEESILFSWSAVDGADSYELSVVRSVPGMEQELYSVTVDEPEYNFTDFEFLTVDRFNWTVIAVGRNGLSVKRSPPARGSFRIIQSEDPKAAVLVIPEIIYK